MNTERTIKVADTKTQKRYTITTNASTLGELKETLRANNIDYSGMEFTEGITKTTLVNDDSILPANVPFRGRTTNDLVILLTNTRKNIASGMDRKEAYALIKKYGLQEEAKSAFGRNFTLVSTADLECLISKAEGTGEPLCKQEETVPEEKEEKEEKAETGGFPVNILNDVISALIDSNEASLNSLYAIEAKLQSEFPDLLKSGSAAISDSDIDDMIAEL